MKKIILGVAVLVFAISCKKENKTIDATPELVENTAPEIENSTESNNLPEFSTEKMADYLADKKNDTLYVTNFFATWCGPCMQEIPHFIAKKKELKDQPVKFTFVSIDEKKDWGTKVVDFAAKNDLAKNIVLLDGQNLDEAFFKNNFQTWDGSGIPFTIIKKGNKREEIFGFTSEETLNQRINILQK
ncbi:TlpA family protein disulfide reductase [Frigoriflavimonas asaccharolytica]|uniref:Thiol-disulfide isomerase/thioredoxin n=1 Tax=Frigoriflavimonas asaccharolytica TaxID=2735899 RepID=A0A8J8GAT3_9FLAO|nr:TlpA disulfide reductase family protein [Frigoriflavimonas asaccharolytica]NRS93132.1 thiol-disulfide isomerase/thioredoxin [Frigoriflavimonas asaccharolytica]